MFVPGNGGNISAALSRSVEGRVGGSDIAEVTGNTSIHVGGSFKPFRQRAQETDSTFVPGALTALWVGLLRNFGTLGGG